MSWPPSWRSGEAELGCVRLWWQVCSPETPCNLNRCSAGRCALLACNSLPRLPTSPCAHPSCAIAPSYAAKLVAVQRELQRRRSASNVFAGRHGFITPRDLFRCGEQRLASASSSGGWDGSVAAGKLQPAGRTDTFIPARSPAFPPAWPVPPNMLASSVLVTLRRWAGRGAVGYQQLAEDGFAVLGERLRSAEERAVVGEVLRKVLGAQVSAGRRGGW